MGKGGGVMTEGKVKRTPAQQLCMDVAEYIEEYGWTKKALTRDGRVCVVGGFLAVDPEIGSTPRYQAYDLLRPHIRPFTSIVNWNDAQKTRKPILAALRKAGGE